MMRTPFETATTVGGQRRGARHRAALRAIRSGVVAEKDGTRHRVVAGRDYWHPAMLSRVQPEFASWFEACDAAEEFRNARSTRRSLRRSTGRLPTTGKRPWRLP